MSEQDVDRRKFITALGGAVAAIGAAALLTPTEVAAEDGETRLPSAQGAWVGTLAAHETIKSLATFMSNGELLTTHPNNGLVSQSHGGGHGVWQQTGRQVDTRLFKFVTDAQGVLTAIAEEITKLEMNETGDTLTGTATFTLYSLDGEVLQSTHGDFTARRITLTGSMEFL